MDSLLECLVLLLGLDLDNGHCNALQVTKLAALVHPGFIEAQVAPPGLQCDQPAFSSHYLLATVANCVLKPEVITPPEARGFAVMIYHSDTCSGSEISACMVLPGTESITISVL